MNLESVPHEYSQKFGRVLYEEGGSHLVLHVYPSLFAKPSFLHPSLSNDPSLSAKPSFPDLDLPVLSVPDLLLVL